MEKLEKCCDIIIVTFNAVDYVKRCIESIKKYTTFRYHLIIVDNNSSYETKKFLSTLTDATIIFNEKNYGFGFANNQALEKSKSDYICFLNPDTIVTDGWLTNLVDILKDKNAGMVGPVTNFVSSTCQQAKLDFTYNVFDNDDKNIHDFAAKRFVTYKTEVVETNRLVGFCLLTTKDVIRQVGVFDERFKIGTFEDDDLCLRIIERGFKIYCCNGVFIYHFGGESFLSNYKTKTNNKVLNINREIYSEKWFKSKRINAIHSKRRQLKVSYLLASDCATGGVKMVFEHANRLKDRGHDVTIYCRIHESSNWFNVRVPIIYSDLEKIPDCDIVVGTYFSTLKFLKNVNAVVKLHFCQGYEVLVHNDENFKKMIRDSYVCVKEKIVVSKWLKEIIDAEFGTNSYYVSNGIDLYVFSFKSHARNEIPRILIVGTDLLDIKGTSIAIEGTKKFSAIKKIEIVRLSSGDQINKTIHCEYHDMTKMSQDKIAEIYKSCDVTVCASKKVEGFSLPPLESMASGTPVITTDSGGVTTYANNGNAIIIPEGNSDLICHNLKILFDNKGLYDKLVENGIETATKLQWHHQIDILENLYYSLYEKYLKAKNEQLSVCVIVKNEEKNLERCLNSIKDIASEIIIVDTGSTDNTIQIAKKFGAEIFHFVWCDDFSKARNFALGKVKQPWTLILDADECISKQDISKLRHLLKQGEFAYNFDTRNYVDSYNVQNIIVDQNDYEEGKEYCGWCKSTKVRLFPSNKEIQFEGKIHELVEGSLKRKKIEILQSNIPIHHFGYLNKKYEEKGKEYLKLNLEKVEENPDLKSIVELATQYMALNNPDEALVLWRRASQISPNNPDFLAKIGTTYNLLNDFTSAEKHFLKSIEIQETEYANQHLGICYAKQENYLKAYECFKKVVFEINDLRTKANFAFCCNVLKKFDESIVILENCLKVDRKETISWGLLEIAYNEKGIELARKYKFDLSLNMFRNALNINPDFKNAKLNIDEISKILRRTRR